MEDLNEIRLNQAMKIEREILWDCQKHDDFSQKHIEECLSEMLSKYIDDTWNYVVDGAILECDQMSSKPVQMYYKEGRLGIKGEGGFVETAYEMTSGGVSTPCFEVDFDEPEIRRFHALNAGQMANGQRFGVISDRSCLRDMIEREGMEDGKEVASLISMGNCKIMKEADVLEIKKRTGRAKIYGTCYCLIKPDFQWVNPYCMESVTGDCDTKSPNWVMPVAGSDAGLNETKCYYTAHHKTMKWHSENGNQEEGLTMLSTLLCIRGGIITVTWSGQRKKLTGRGLTIEFQFTLEQLKACGWEHISEEELRKLNSAMQRFGVTSRESAYMMIATMLSESENCTVRIEGGEGLITAMGTKGTETAWKEYKAAIMARGNIVGGYEWWERGAGYIQLTGEKEQERFLEDMKDSYTGRDKASYIADNYPAESAVWYWTNVQKTGEGNLNAYVEKYGASEGTFLITQYFINGYAAGIDDTLRSIRDGGKYTIYLESNKLSANGKEFPLPNGWELRGEKWKNVEEQMRLYAF